MIREFCQLKLTTKLILNVIRHGLRLKKIFSSRLSKTALNIDFLPPYLTEKISEFHLVLEDFYKKELR